MMRYHVSQGAALATTVVHDRVDEKVKEEAAETLAKMSMSVSDAVRMMLVQVAADTALPFEVRVPNATAVRAIKAANHGKGRRFRSAEALLRDPRI
jgi:DNA-damage-inducible protein J